MAAFNYFAQGMDGKRYSRSRPYIHATAIEKIRSLAEITAPVPRALDVGCGTGQSAIALAEIATSIIGMDPSADMLAHALSHPRVRYVQSSAEDIPLANNQFELITVAQAFHWFSQDSFLAEASRLLRADGWLMIYTSWFTCDMKEDPSFSNWFKGDYLDRYPSPPRNRRPITGEIAEAFGFILRGENEFRDNVSMTSERFTDYQLSTTNVIAAVERGDDTYDNAARWIHASIVPYFAKDVQRTFLFLGRLWGLEKMTYLGEKSAIRIR